MSEEISNETKITIFNAINEAMFREQAYISATFGITLIAITQVQGILIKAAELGARVKSQKTKESDLIDILLDFIIYAAITFAAGKLVSIGFKAIIKPVINSRKAFYFKSITRDALAPEIFIDSSQIKRIIAEIPKKLSDDFVTNKKSDDFKAFKKIPEKMVEKALGHLFEKAKNPSIPAPLKKKAKPNSGLIPVAEIQRRAEEDYEIQKYTSAVMYEGLKTQLLWGKIDKDAGKSLLEFLTLNISIYPREEIGLISDHLIKWEEFSIWAFKFNPDVSYKIDPGYRHPTPVKRLTTMSSSENSRLRDSLDDTRNYKILPSNNKNEVVFNNPRVEPDGGDRSVKIDRTTIRIAPFILDYLIDKFGPRVNTAQALTYREVAEKRRRSRPIKNQHTDHSDFYDHQKDRDLIEAYESLFKDFHIWWRDLKKYKKRLK